jgi:hypothetical protein
MIKSTKADQVRAWLNGSNLNSREIAEAVGCHQGFVLAIKQRMLHPERERKRRNDWFRYRYQNDIEFAQRCRQEAIAGYHRRKAEARA